MPGLNPIKPCMNSKEIMQVIFGVVDSITVHWQETHRKSIGKFCSTPYGGEWRGGVFTTIKAAQVPQAEVKTGRISFF